MYLTSRRADLATRIVIRLLIAIGSVAAAAFTSITLLDYGMSQVEQSAISSTVDASRRVNSVLEDAHSFVDSVASHVRVEENGLVFSEFLNEVLDSGTRNNRSHVGVVVLDARGVVVATAAPRLGLGMSFEESDFFRALLDGRSPEYVVGAPRHSQVSGAVLIPFARAVRAGDGTVVGAVAAGISLDAVKDAMSASDDSDNWLLRSDGLSLASSKDGRPRFDRAEFDSIASSDKNEGTFGRKSLLQEAPSVTAWRKSSVFPVMVLSSRPFFPAMYRSLLEIAGVMLAEAGLLLFLAIASYLSEREIRADRKFSKTLEVERDRARFHEERLIGILATAYDPVLILDNRMRISFYNDAAAKLFDVSSDEAVGGSIDRFIPIPLRRGHAALMQGVSEGPDMSRSMNSWRNVEALHSSGRTIPVLISISKATYERSPSYLVIIRDITQIREAEIKLKALLEAQEKLTEVARASDRAKSMFLASVNHELRTPLNAIIGFSESLKLGIAGPLGSKKVEEYISDIHSSGQHLYELINFIIDRTMIENQEAEGAPTLVRLGAAWDQSLTILRHLADKKSIKICAPVIDPETTVVGNGASIRQVIVNVVGNAIKFSPPASKVSVIFESDEAAEVATLLVRDAGPGMSPAILERVGQPFLRNHDITIADAGGLGLGLSISVGVLKKIGGNLSFRNRTPAGLDAHIELRLSRSPDRVPTPEAA